MHLKVTFLPTSTNEKEFAKQFEKRQKKFGFHDMKLMHCSKAFHFDSLKDEISRGTFIQIHQATPTDKFIKCELAEDVWAGFIPCVTESNHPRFVVGTRFDYGFMCVALREGYRIFYNRSNKIRY
jgi:hypothetical protein